MTERLCACGCGEAVPDRRKYVSESHRKRAQRAVKRQELLDDLDAPSTGSVAQSIVALVEQRDPQPGTIGHALGRLAERQAELVDEDPGAATALRMTLAALDEAAEAGDDGEDRFDLWEIIDAITREGVDPHSRLGHALLLYRPDPDDTQYDDYQFELTTNRPPPQWPNCWRGIAVDGPAADYSREHGGTWPDLGALDFWPLATCPMCGHTERTDDTEKTE